MPGLVTTSEDDTGAGGNAPEGGGGLEASVSTGPVESHLDSFFDGSGWTREDMLVVLTLFELALFAMLVYSEVNS